MATTPSSKKNERPQQLEETGLLKLINGGKEERIELLQKITSDLKVFQLSDIKKFVFKKSDISSGDGIKDFVKQEKIPNQGKWIYIFCGGDLPALSEKFQNTRDRSPVKFAKANGNPDESHCIYVGSSSNLAKRIEEQLGRVSDSTYAVRFNEWLPGEVEITCFYFEVETQSQELLQNFEDGIWNKLNPIIGKKGGK